MHDYILQSALPTILGPCHLLIIEEDVRQSGLKLEGKPKHQQQQHNLSVPSKLG